MTTIVNCQAIVICERWVLMREEWGLYISYNCIWSCWTSDWHQNHIFRWKMRSTKEKFLPHLIPILDQKFH